jgi:hypothetical protein
MSENQEDFMNLDLTKLTLVGWLMMLLTIATVLGLMIGLALLLELVGISLDDPEGGKRRWLMGVCLLAGVAAGVGFFEGGRRLLNHLGLPLLRGSEREDGSERTRER